MTKRKNRSPAPTNELEMLLEGIEDTIPEGLLAEMRENGDLDEALIVAGALIETAISTEFDNTIESLEPTHLDDTDASALAELAGDPEVITVQGEEIPVIDKQAIYDAQDSEVITATAEDAAPVLNAKGRKRAKAAAASAPKVPRVKVETGQARSTTLAGKIDTDALVKIGFKDAEVVDLIAKIDGLPKKVTEKAFNMIRFAAGRERLSNYTSFALEFLRDNGPCTIPEMVKAMELPDARRSKGWSPATSRSQAQQMSKLLATYDMTTKSEGKIDLNRKNPLVKNALARLAA
jgi:hypothetical protein